MQLQLQIVHYLIQCAITRIKTTQLNILPMLIRNDFVPFPYILNKCTFNGTTLLIVFFVSLRNKGRSDMWTALMKQRRRVLLKEECWKFALTLLRSITSPVRLFAWKIFEDWTSFVFSFFFFGRGSRKLNFNRFRVVGPAVSCPESIFRMACI